MRYLRVLNEQEAAETTEKQVECRLQNLDCGVRYSAIRSPKSPFHSSPFPRISCSQLHTANPQYAEVVFEQFLRTHILTASNCKQCMEGLGIGVQAHGTD